MTMTKKELYLKAYTNMSKDELRKLAMKEIIESIETRARLNELGDSLDAIKELIEREIQ